MWGLPRSTPAVLASRGGVCAAVGGAGSALTPSLPQGMKQSYDEYADSDEDQHDAYLERMKEEGKIREENANDSSDGSGEETGGCRGRGGVRGHPGGLSGVPRPLPPLVTSLPRSWAGSEP